MLRNSELGSFFKNPYHVFSVGVSFLLVIVSTWLVVRNISRESEQVILHYTATFGPDQFGEGALLYRLPIVAGLLWVVHVGLAIVFWGRRPAISMVMSVSLLFLQIFLLIAVVGLVYVNGDFSQEFVQ